MLSNRTVFFHQSRSQTNNFLILTRRIRDEGMADACTIVNPDEADDSISYEVRILAKILLGKPVQVRSLESKFKVKEIKQVVIHISPPFAL